MSNTEMHTAPLRSVTGLWNKRPLIIAGPCSAETKEQLLQTAIQLKGTGKVDVLRAGIWKPRTRPGNFEGIGVEGLPWMQAAKRETQLPFIIEIANARQLEEALRHDADAVWIGARTTVNPFSVQEIADALQGVRLPVFIKNPVTPDLELWIGAYERIAQCGIEKIGIVHRGFSTYGSSGFRNAPMWQLAIDMKRRFPGTPFIIDPSHICGNRILLQEVMQNAIDLDYDGIMVESHYDPDNAWSDASQQVTPAALGHLLDRLIWRKEKADSPELHDKLEKLRREIDRLDDEVIRILSRRMHISEKIGTYKKTNNITILQTERWNEILARVCRNGQEAGLSAEFIRQYFDAIHMESIKHQDSIMNR